MKTQIIRVQTGRRDAVHDIAGSCADFAREASAGGDGLLHVFVPHATAGVAVIELGAGSDRDLLAVLADLKPPDDRGQHTHGSRGDEASTGWPGSLLALHSSPLRLGRPHTASVPPSA